MLNYIETFCNEIRFPQEAIHNLLQNYNELRANEICFKRFNELVEYFKNHDSKDEYESIFSQLDDIAKLSGIHNYSIHMLYLIALSIHTRKLYEEKNISFEIYLDSMSDLRAKLMECNELYGVWGTSVAWWEIDLFNLNLVALGRLQYELIPFQSEYTNGIHSLKQGDMVLNVHIPSLGPLLYEDCKASFQKAALHFQDCFKGEPVAFVCNSWLLYPDHREFLPPNSNILKFMSFFDIISSEISVNKSDLWRVFYKDWEKAPIDLPRNTSIQRSYADWLLKGNHIGTGLGVFFYEDELQIPENGI
jgi:hypothetical protein